MLLKQVMTILILLCLTAPGAWASSDFFSGRVLKLDPEQGRMVVAPFRAGHHGMHKPNGGNHGMDGHGCIRNLDKIEVLFLPASLPGEIREGMVIRIRGQFLVGSPVRFRAEQFLPFEGLSNDSTGVRKRLLNDLSRDPNTK